MPIDRFGKRYESVQIQGETMLKDGMEIKFNRKHLKKETGNVFAHQKTYINGVLTEYVPRTLAHSCHTADKPLI